MKNILVICAIFVVFGCEKQQNVNTLPTLSTIEASLITSNSAVSGGTNISGGGLDITSKGVVWGVSINPTILLTTKTNDGSGSSSFTSTITGLAAETKYYIRAYAINNIGTNYGNEISITTRSSSSFSNVTSANGKIWMDRNLGASRVATSTTDTSSYGDLYQWGRANDQHQLRKSTTTNILATSDIPGNANFILPSIPPYDWRIPQNTNLWQGASGINNPCPSGYRIPTEAEWNTELASWSSKNADGAFASPLKLTLAGNREALINFAGTYASYWSSTISGEGSRYLYISSTGSYTLTHNRSYGGSIRCIKD